MRQHNHRPEEECNVFCVHYRTPTHSYPHCWLFSEEELPHEEV